MLVQLFATPLTTESMEFSRPEYKNAGVHSHFLFQGIFPAQGLNPGLLHCGQIRLSEPQGKLVSESHLVVSDSMGPYGLYSPWNSPDYNIWSG